MIAWRAQIKIAVGALIVAVSMLVWPLLQDMIKEARPIRHVGVEGEFQYISKEDIQSKIIPLIQDGYFAIDLQEIQQAVMSLPWAEKVQVQRIWPDGVKLKLYEQKPVVRWQTDGLLNVRGEVFKPLNIDEFKFLPALYGPAEQRQQLLEIMYGLRVSLMDQGLRLTEFRVSNRQSWLLVMENGMTVQLGRFEPLNKLTLLLKAFVVSGSELVNKMAYVDMRYPNGYAVRWRENEQIRW
ncbi:MAG: FtsQ-type POTRA domain-containing protein [Methyloprofundus sp.]|nr:FtsQ-type POTRA domain-containing protein [Methyloprofundus sp.]MBW6452334.1 FtsQ-type POTRA domain-containing protein [Methyloprofundus sp.]